MDKASDFESEDWGFESLRGRIFTAYFVSTSVHVLIITRIGTNEVLFIKTAEKRQGFESFRCPIDLDAFFVSTTVYFFLPIIVECKY